MNSVERWDEKKAELLVGQKVDWTAELSGESWVGERVALLAGSKADPSGQKMAASMAALWDCLRVASWVESLAAWREFQRAALSASRSAVVRAARKVRR